MFRRFLTKNILQILFHPVGVFQTKNVEAEPGNNAWFRAARPAFINMGRFGGQSYSCLPGNTCSTCQEVAYGNSRYIVSKAKWTFIMPEYNVYVFDVTGLQYSFDDI
jgi:hypothetical protein